MRIVVKMDNLGTNLETFATSTFQTHDNLLFECSYSNKVVVFFLLLIGTSSLIETDLVFVSFSLDMIGRVPSLNFEM